MPQETPKPKSSSRRPPRGESTPRTDTRASNGASAPEPKPKQRTPNDRKLAASIAGTYQMAGGLAAGLGLRFQDEGLVGVGAATIEQSEALAEAWLDLAEQNPRVRAALTRMVEASATANLVALHVAVLLPLLVNRGLVPAGFVVGMSGNGSGTPANN